MRGRVQAQEGGGGVRGSMREGRRDSKGGKVVVDQIGLIYVF